MARQWQQDSSSSAAQPALALPSAAQLSSLAGSAGHPAGESYRRAWDGELYTRAEFLAYYGPDLGEAHWQSAQSDLPQWDGPANVPAIGAPLRRRVELSDRTVSLAQNDVPAISAENQRGRSAAHSALTLPSSLPGTWVHHLGDRHMALVSTYGNRFITRSREIASVHRAQRILSGEYARDTIWVWIRLAQGSLSKTRWIQFWADPEIQVEVLAASVFQSSFGPTTVNGG